MTGSRKRVGLLALLLTLGLVLFTSSVAWAQTDDTSTDDTSADSVADDGDTSTTEIVEVTETEDTEWIPIWGGIGLVVILAIALVWYFFLRDKGESGGEA
jgi:hypothetical protein